MITLGSARQFSMCFTSVLNAFVVFCVHTPIPGASNFNLTALIDEIIFVAGQKIPGRVDPKHFLSSDANRPKEFLFSEDAVLKILGYMIHITNNLWISESTIL